jgi:hypothetical protein
VNTITDRHHNTHVVLDQENAATERSRNGLDQGHEMFALHVGHAGGRLVEQKKGRSDDERACDADPSLVGVGERRGEQMRLVVEFDPAEYFGGHVRGHTTGKSKAGRRHFDILDHGHVLEQAAGLKRPRHTRTPEIVGLPAGGVLAIEQHATARWPLKACEAIDQCGLAGPIGTDEAEHFVPIDGEGHFGERRQSLEVHA